MYSLVVLCHLFRRVLISSFHSTLTFRLWLKTAWGFDVCFSLTLAVVLTLGQSSVRSCSKYQFSFKFKLFCLFPSDLGFSPPRCLSTSGRTVVSTIFTISFILSMYAVFVPRSNEQRLQYNVCYVGNWAEAAGCKAVLIIQRDWNRPSASQRCLYVRGGGGEYWNGNDCYKGR